MRLKLHTSSDHNLIADVSTNLVRRDGAHEGSSEQLGFLVGKAGEQCYSGRSVLLGRHDVDVVEELG
jgi:hypothetical protein